MKQLLTSEEIIGKKITGIFSDYNELFLKLNADEFVVLEVKDTTEGFGQTTTKVSISDYKKDFTCSALLKLKLITEDEYTDAVKNQEKEWKLHRIESDRARQAEFELQEREQYEKLSKKYRK